MDLDFSTPFTQRTPRIVAAAKLHRSAGRRKAKAFLVEGENCVEAAVASGAARDVFVTQQAAQRYEDIVRSAGYLNVYVHPISDDAARALAETVTSPGIFAVCEPVTWPVAQVLKGRPQLVAVPVEVREPGNAGTLVRVADAVGADSVIFAGDTVDPLAGKVTRATAGSVFHIPVARERNTHRVLDSLRGRGLTLLATTASGQVSLDEAEELLARPHAWLFGNEAHGLDPEILAQADTTVSIPMRGRAESLNLATAASICLYESSRAQARAAQRQGSGESE